MQTKAFSAITIKALHEEERKIEGIASTPALDRVKDIVEPTGLYFAADAPLLLNHDHSQPVGSVQFGTPTDKGLPFTATIAKVAEPGVVKDRTDEAWHSVKSGLIKGVSIGFIPDEYELLGEGKGVRFTKASVHELSLVAIPCNPEAVITAFKSLAKSETAVAVEVPGETPEEPAAAAATQNGEEVVPTNEAEDAANKAASLSARKALLLSL
jgi:HK97 family phage prohead protease